MFKILANSENIKEEEFESYDDFLSIFEKYAGIRDSFLIAVSESMVVAFSTHQLDYFIRRIVIVREKYPHPIRQIIDLKSLKEHPEFQGYSYGIAYGEAIIKETPDSLIITPKGGCVVSFQMDFTDFSIHKFYISNGIFWHCVKY